MNQAAVRTRSVARRLVKPVIGADAWAFLRDVDRSVKQFRRDRASSASASAASAPGKSGKSGQPEKLEQPGQPGKAKAAGAGKGLTALAKEFRTDKWGNHFYTPHYERHLKHLRDEPIRLLEIGIGGYNRAGEGGASLRMWKRFFGKASIVGLDIEDKSHVQEERIRVYQGDQTDPELLLRMNAQAGPFDVIIDDGSHRPHHILATFDILFPLLAPNGIYVVEDIQTSYWPEWGGSDDPNAPNTSMTMLKNLCDGLNHMEFVDESYEPTYTDRHVIAVHFYHNLVFVQKGDNNEGTRRRQILRKRYEPVEPAAPAV